MIILNYNELINYCLSYKLNYYYYKRSFPSNKIHFYKYNLLHLHIETIMKNRNKVDLMSKVVKEEKTR